MWTITNLLAFPFFSGRTGFSTFHCLTGNLFYWCIEVSVAAVFSSVLFLVCSVTLFFENYQLPMNYKFGISSINRTHFEHYSHLTHLDTENITLVFVIILLSATNHNFLCILFFKFYFALFSTKQTPSFQPNFLFNSIQLLSSPLLSSNPTKLTQYNNFIWKWLSSPTTLVNY